MWSNCPSAKHLPLQDMVVWKMPTVFVSCCPVAATTEFLNVMYIGILGGIELLIRFMKMCMKPI
jgi:hypothetical protein